MFLRIENPQKLKSQLKSKTLVLYGMGTIGIEIANWCDSQKIDYVFIDKKITEKQKLSKTKSITTEALIKYYMDANIVISTNIYFDEIKNYLLNNGFNENQILSYDLFLPQSIIWKDLENNINWDLMRPSVNIFSQWINDKIESIVDYGAGQMYLKSFLNSKIKYYPIDYIKRFDETIVCDLNTGNFPDIQADVSIFNGVLEFLTTAEKLLQFACEKTKKIIIISYMTVNKFPNISARRASGYVSDLSEEQILDLLIKNSFKLKKKEFDPLDNTDTLYLFEK